MSMVIFYSVKFLQDIFLYGIGCKAMWNLAIKKLPTNNNN